MSILELVAVAAKLQQNYTIDESVRMVLTPDAVYLPLAAHNVADKPLLPVAQLLAMAKQILAVPHVWVWHSMSDTVRKQFTKIVGKDKVQGSDAPCAYVVMSSMSDDNVLCRAS